MGRTAALGPIIVVFTLQHLQHQMMRPYVPLFAASLDVGYFGIGVIAAAVSFLPMFFAIPVGRLTDRAGVKPLVLAGAVLGGTSYLLLALLPSITMIVLCQLAAGIANLFIVLGAQAYVGSLGRGVAAERNFGTYTIYASIGQIAGPILGGLLVSFIGYAAAFMVASSLSVLALASALVLLRGQQALAPRKAEATQRRGAFRYLREPATRLAIIASCLMSIPEILRTSFLPIYLGDVVKLDPAWLGYILGLFSVAGLVAKTVLPRVVARFGRHVMLWTITTACGITVAVIPVFVQWQPVAVIVIAMGLTFGLGRPLSMAMAANSAQPGEIGIVVGLRISGNRVADFGLPMLFGSAASLSGIAAPFLVGGILMFLGAGYLFRPMIDEYRSRR